MYEPRMLCGMDVVRNGQVSQAGVVALALAIPIRLGYPCLRLLGRRMSSVDPLARNCPLLKLVGTAWMGKYAFYAYEFLLTRFWQDGSTHREVRAGYSGVSKRDDDPYCISN